MDDDHVVATWGRTFIQIWRGAATDETTKRVNELAATFIAASAAPATSILVVESKSPSPNDACRKNFAAFSRDLTSRMKMSIVVAEGVGFRGALVRAVGAALSTILPHRSGFKFVDDVSGAADLIAPFLEPNSGGPAALVRAAKEARAKIGKSDFSLAK